jgi:NhaP-type Na+/H+ or K+/H+ antiporter
MTIRMCGKRLEKSSRRLHPKRSGYAKPKLILGFEGPRKKVSAAFVGILLKILDQHNLVAGLVVDQLIHHLFRKQ